MYESFMEVETNLWKIGPFKIDVVGKNCICMLQINMPGNNLEKNRIFGVVLRKNNFNRKNKLSTKVSFLFHEAPNIKSSRKMIILIGVEENNLRKSKLH